MPQLGSAEILVILVIAVLVFGPTRLPELSRNIGRAVRELTKVRDEFQRELKDVMPPELDEVRRELRAARRDLDDAVRPRVQGTRGPTPMAPAKPTLTKSGTGQAAKPPTGQPSTAPPSTAPPSTGTPSNGAGAARPGVEPARGERPSLAKGGTATPQPPRPVPSRSRDDFDLDGDPAFGRGVAPVEGPGDHDG